MHFPTLFLHIQSHGTIHFTIYFKALRAALYDQSNVGESTESILQAADNKIEMAKAGGEAGLEGTVRLKGHVEITSPPSDISSIDGNEERNCHTPNSLSSNENKVGF